MNIADETFLALSSLPDLNIHVVHYDVFLYALSCLFEYVSLRNNKNISEQTLSDELHELIQHTNNQHLTELEHALKQWDVKWYDINNISCKIETCESRLKIENIRLAMLSVYDDFTDEEDKQGYIYQYTITNPLSHRRCTNCN